MFSSKGAFMRLNLHNILHSLSDWTDVLAIHAGKSV